MTDAASGTTLAAHQPDLLRGLLLALAAYAIYACSDAAVKLLHGALPPFEVVFIGAVLGLPVVPFVRDADERWLDLLRCNDRRMWCLRAAAAILGSLFSVMAFTLLSMAEAFALIFLMPAIVTVLSVIVLHEPVRWRRWTAVVVGFVGVLVVLRPGFRTLHAGHFAALGCGVAGAVTVVLLRALGPSEKRISLYGAGLVGPLVASFVLMLPHFVVPIGREWLEVAAYGLLAAVGNILMMRAAAAAPASLLAPTHYSQMLWGILFGYLLFGDGVDAPMLFGSALIIGAGLFTFSRERVRRPRWWQRSPSVHPQ